MTGRIDHPSELRQNHAYTLVKRHRDQPTAKASITAQAIFSSVAADNHLPEWIVAHFHPFGKCWHSNNNCYWNPKTGWCLGGPWYTSIFDEGPLTPEQQRWMTAMQRQDSTTYRLDLACQLAEMLLAHQSVARIGLFGSVARGEPISHDIDLVLFIDDERLLTQYLEELEFLDQEDNNYTPPSETILQILGLDHHAIDQLFYGQPWFKYAGSGQHYELVYQSCNLIMLPNSPEDHLDWLKRFQNTQWDEEFVTNLAVDCRLFDPHHRWFGEPGVLPAQYSRAIALTALETVPA